MSDVELPVPSFPLLGGWASPDAKLPQRAEVTRAEPSSNCARWASETVFATSSQRPAGREMEPVPAALPVMALPASAPVAVRG